MIVEIGTEMQLGYVSVPITVIMEGLGSDLKG
jgi:hypothetical protein